MSDSDLTWRPTIRTSSVVAPLFVIVLFAALYWHFSGDMAPDWDGYGRLYDDEGGWLLSTGREPGFVWLLNQARAVFGLDGYENFRLMLFCVFTGFAVWLAHRAPEQTALQPFGAFVVVLIIVLAFLLKGLVQIREGVAFLFIAAPMVALFGLEKRRFWRVGIGAVLAAVVHAATVIFAVAWLVAVGICLTPDRIMAKWAFQRALVVAALATGAVITVTVLRNPDAVNFLLQDFGVDRRADSYGAVWKYVYWGVNGGFALLIRWQLIGSVKDVSKFAHAYASAIGSVLLPTTYAICLGLVVFGSGYGAVTSMAIRLFFTTTELAMIIIVLRGRADLVTMTMAAAMIADRARLMVTV